MTEEYGGVHTIERRSGVDRRASTWREAVDQQHEARRRQYVALLAALDALVVEIRAYPPLSPNPRFWADRLTAELAKHREPS